MPLLEPVAQGRQGYPKSLRIGGVALKQATAPAVIPFTQVAFHEFAVNVLPIRMISSRQVVVNRDQRR